MRTTALLLCIVKSPLPEKRKAGQTRPCGYVQPKGYLMRATPPEISMVSAPVRASRSPLGKVTKQPLKQKSTVSPAPIANSDLLPPSVTIIVRGSWSLLRALAPKATPPAPTRVKAARIMVLIAIIGVATASVGSQGLSPIAAIL